MYVLNNCTNFFFGSFLMVVLFDIGWGLGNLEKRREVLPPEIEKFYISEDSLKSILGKSFGAEVESLDLSNGEVNIALSNSFLNEILGDIYKREIDSVDLNGDEAKITLGEQQMKVENESKEGDNEQETSQDSNAQNESNNPKDNKSNTDASVKAESENIEPGEKDDLSVRLEQIRNAL